MSAYLPLIIRRCTDLLRVRVLVSLLLSLSFTIGCGGQQKLNQKTGGQKIDQDDEQTFDMNEDGKTDVWRKFVLEGKKKRLVQKSFDLNYDGKIDFRRYYTANSKVERDEMDKDFDGTFDQFIFYKDNQVIRKEVSLSGDAHPEVVKYYDLGELKYVKYDKDRDSKYEYWEYFRGDKLARVGYDSDQDGSPERFVELD